MNKALIMAGSIMKVANTLASWNISCTMVRMRSPGVNGILSLKGNSVDSGATKTRVGRIVADLDIS